MDRPDLKAGKPNKYGEGGSLPKNTIYEKPLKQKAIKDKTGWEVRPENRMILDGNLSPADKGNGLLPEGFDQPKSNKATK